MRCEELSKEASEAQSLEGLLFVAITSTKRVQMWEERRAVYIFVDKSRLMGTNRADRSRIEFAPVSRLGPAPDRTSIQKVHSPRVISDEADSKSGPARQLPGRE